MTKSHDVDKSNIWFTADFHFGHDRIIEICNRPFKNAAVMDKQLIKNYNSVVGDNDTVFVLGDFSLRGSSNVGYHRDILGKLRGHKHLILGNHDVENAWFHTKNGFLSAHTHLSLELDGIRVVMVHDPAESALDRNVPYLCGHVHDLFRVAKNAINVGVDVWGYAPVSWYEIRNILNGGNAT